MAGDSLTRKPVLEASTLDGSINGRILTAAEEAEAFENLRVELGRALPIMRAHFDLRIRRFCSRFADRRHVSINRRRGGSRSRRVTHHRRARAASRARPRPRASEDDSESLAQLTRAAA
jgi:hypothetical protein